ncbi:GTPase activating factor, partial [Cryomyces antarcticus]
MTTFGSKEHWMEPMNQFLSSHRTEFKTFIDSICNLTPSDVAAVTTLPPSYSTPLAILQRLPPTSREGFPSLPYLIDQSRGFAALVTLWLDSVTKKSSNIPQSDVDIATFHAVCTSLQERTHDFLERAERAERPNSGLSLKWEELVEQLEDGQLDTPSRRESLTGLDDRGQSHLPALAPTTSAFSTTTIMSASLSTPSGSPQLRAASEAGRGDADAAAADDDDDTTFGSASAS